MRPTLRAAASIDSLFFGLIRRRHNICRQCQNRLRIQSSKPSTRIQRAAFSLSSKKRNEPPALRLTDDTREYTEAEDWDGLEWIGSRDWLDAKEARPVTHNIFLREPPLNEPKDISAALHRALVEVYALAAANQELWSDAWSTNVLEDSDAAADEEFEELNEGTEEMDVRAQEGTGEIEEASERSEQTRNGTEAADNGIEAVDEGTEAADEWVYGAGKDIKDAGEEIEAISGETDGVRLRLDRASKRTILVFPDEEVKENLCHALGDISIPDDLCIVEQPAGSSEQHQWDGLTMGSDAEKFAIIKRTMQLTGIRIPDATINACSTPHTLLAALTAKPKNIKVANALSDDERLDGINNLTIFDRRVNGVDKDQQLGRWKVIRRELEQRGLPLYG